MWPFKTLEERIGDLEDEIAGKKARLDSIETTFSGFTKKTSYWIEERAKLAEQIAVMTNRCGRMKRMSSNAEVSGAGTASEPDIRLHAFPYCQTYRSVSLRSGGVHIRKVRAQWAELDELLGEYFDAGVLEGRERRNHDTPDGAAQKALDAIRYCVKRMIEDEREACAKACDDERAEFMAKAGENNGRESDFAFGSVNSAERIKAAIMMRSNAKVTGAAPTNGSESDNG